MKTAVLNGSPKGSLSVTLQYIRYIEKYFKNHQFDYMDISSKISAMEKKEDLFNDVLRRIDASDLIIWSVPLYVCLVPSQYKRFIELILERNAQDRFRGKAAAVVTSSIHFYDHTAHNYMRGICDDMGMVFAGAFSPDMYDLVKETERKRLLNFASIMFGVVESGRGFSRASNTINYAVPLYIPGRESPPLDVRGKKILILADRPYGESNLGKMIERMAKNYGGAAKVRYLSDVDIKGGCLGCCECGFDYKCVYTGKDGFIDFYNSEIKPSDIIVYAGEIRDRYLSADWKRMFDRAFFNTHTPTLTGKQIGFLVSGPLRQLHNLREILSSYAEWQAAGLVDFVTDEDTSPEVDGNIDTLAARLVEFADREYLPPPTFRALGGMKVFRDDVWGRLRFVFQADHKYYEENGLYDFPQDDAKTIERNKKMMELTSHPELRENIRKMIKREMVKPHLEVVERK